jgi:cellulose 1,4-beta-cellobiosidase
LKFIGGKANVAGWTPSSNDQNSGVGNMGSCCSEMDIWEANSMGAAVTPHPCSTTGYSVCQTDACGGTDSPSNRYGSVCDPDGCDFNSYRMGNTSFYGKGLIVDTSQKFTVVTQFITSDGTANGQLSEIRRFYVQNGKVIPNSYSNIAGMSKQYNSITEDFCDAQKAAFGDNTGFESKGGLAQMGKAMANGMVLVMSLWDDHAVNMLWLDSTYPTNATASTPGAARGPCSTSSGVPATVESQDTSASVTYSNIKFGPINSTFTAH